MGMLLWLCFNSHFSFIARVSFFLFALRRKLFPFVLREGKVLREILGLIYLCFLRDCVFMYLRFNEILTIPSPSSLNRAPILSIQHSCVAWFNDIVLSSHYHNQAELNWILMLLSRRCSSMEEAAKVQECLRCLVVFSSSSSTTNINNITMRQEKSKSFRENDDFIVCFFISLPRRANTSQTNASGAELELGMKFGERFDFNVRLKFHNFFYQQTRTFFLSFHEMTVWVVFHLRGEARKMRTWSRNSHPCGWIRWNVHSWFCNRIYLHHQQNRQRQRRSSEKL